MPAKVKILYIEDDPDDIVFLKMALDDDALDYRLETVMRGDLVIPFLSGSGYRPDIIIMDLNLPKIHGRELVKLIRSRSELRTVPLLVLTTSSLHEDIAHCMKHGADSYVTKPSDPDGFAVLAGTVRRMAEGVLIKTKADTPEIL
jgi:CheY-like chemotaxis protein